MSRFVEVLLTGFLICLITVMSYLETIAKQWNSDTLIRLYMQITHAYAMSKRHISRVLDYSNNSTSETTIVSTRLDRSTEVPRDKAIMTTGLSESEISRLTDMLGARKLMKKLGVDTRRCNSLVEAKDRLRSHIAQLHASPESNSAASFIDEFMVGRTIAADKEKRKHLCEILERTGKLIQEQDTQLQQICAVRPDTSERIGSAIGKLKEEQCSILIGGETSAGKSTFVNLLLGQMDRDLLPVAHLSCSSVITEIRYSASPQAVIYPWPDDVTTPPVYMPLSEDDAHKQLEPYIYQKGDRNKRFPYYKVEIYWNSPWLKKAGVSLVDSPGVGESPFLNEMVQNYLSQAFGFIYIINSSNAGGIQPERLADLLDSARKEYEGQTGEVQFDPESVIFVANKWDQIPDGDRSDVHQDICDKLYQCCPEFTKSQIYPFSAKESRDIQRHGGEDKCYNAILRGIKDLLPASLNQRLIQQHRVLKHVIWFASHALDVNICSNQQGGEIGKRMDVLSQAMSSLDELKRKTKELQRDIEKNISSALIAAEHQIRTYLESREAFDRICDWKASDCPFCEDEDTLKASMVDAATSKIGIAVNKWEREEGVFRQIQTGIVNQLENNIAVFHQELRAIQNAVIMGFLEETSVDRLSTSVDIGKVALKIPINFKLPFWAPIAFFIKRILCGKDEAAKLKEEVTLKTYDQNKRQYMRTVSYNVLKEILNGKKLMQLMERKITQLKSWSLRVQGDIPVMIAAEESILRQCRSDIETQSMRIEVLLNLRREFTLLHEKSCLFKLQAIKSYDIENVAWKDSKPFARGKYWQYHRANLRDKCPSEKVTLKIPVAPLNGQCAAKFILEEEYLGSTNDDFVVKMLGTATEKVNDGNIMPMIVLKKFSCSLDSIIHNPEVYVPPGDNTRTVAEKHIQLAARLASELADGLLYLHENGLVHGNLMPQNILVTEEMTINLAECNKIFKHNKSPGTLDVENDAYMAPEVRTCGYDSYADVFSYGLILWQLWHGKPLEQIYDPGQASLESLHFQVTNTERVPHPTWSDMILSCTSVIASERPKMQIVARRMRQFNSLVYPIVTNYDVLSDI